MGAINFVYVVAKFAEVWNIDSEDNSAEKSCGINRNFRAVL